MTLSRQHSIVGQSCRYRSAAEFTGAGPQSAALVCLPESAYYVLRDSGGLPPQEGFDKAGGLVARRLVDRSAGLGSRPVIDTVGRAGGHAAV
jgi:hypothetical protein